MSEITNRYVEFFFTSRRNVQEFETVEISHPSFSAVRRVVRNAPNGLAVTLENGEPAYFEYYPLEIRQLAERGDLDYGLGIDVGDLGEMIPDEIDRVIDADALGVSPVVIYRTYRSDDLTAPMFGPVHLEVAEIPRTREGATLEAMAPSLNLAKTGEIYDLDRFPMLRGFL